jgi:hypothetical protein
MVGLELEMFLMVGV